MRHGKQACELCRRQGHKLPSADVACEFIDLGAKALDWERFGKDELVLECCFVPEPVSDSIHFLHMLYIVQSRTKAAEIHVVKGHYGHEREGRE